MQERRCANLLHISSVIDGGCQSPETHQDIFMPAMNDRLLTDTYARRELHGA